MVGLDLWMSLLEEAGDQWLISVLWCCSDHSDIWMYAWLSCPVLFSQPVPCVLFLILGCTSGKKNVCHQLLNMCLYNISPACLWECSWSGTWLNLSASGKRDYQDVDDQTGDVFFQRWNFETNHNGWIDSPPHSVSNDLLCPDLVVLTACPCFILSYQSNMFGICTQPSHSTQCKTGTVCFTADDYGYS